MSKTVLYRDSYGLSQTGELMEFEIDKFYSDDDPDSKGRRGYGFARPVGTPRGTMRGIFMHVSNRYYYMRAYGTKKLEYLPEFTNLLSSRDYETEIQPARGVHIIGVVGEGRKGPEMVAWSTNTNAYEKALKQCELYLELERERIERDPLFRLMRTIIVPGRPEGTPTKEFEGNKSQVERKYPLGSFNSVAGRPDPTRSRNYGDTEYIMTWNRETEEDDGWERFHGDPRTTRFQLTRHQAFLLLRHECTRRLDEDGLPVWTSRKEQRIVADVAYDNSDTRIVFEETNAYLETAFTGKAMDDLWNIGAPDEFGEPATLGSHVPNSDGPTPYERQLNKRAAAHEAHDLAQLGRSSSEWEEISRRYRD